jgi:hypothetical protein
LTLEANDYRALFSYHLEPFVSIFARNVTVGAVNAAPLTCCLGSLSDSGNSIFELLIEFAEHWMPDIIT